MLMRPYFRFMRFLSQSALAMYFGGRVFDMENVPKSGGVVLACNHQSFFDPLAATCAIHREGNFLARDTLFRNPLFGRLIRSVNAFPVKRGKGDLGAIKEVLRRLKNGKMVLIFPEGTRTRDGSIGAINPNSMAVAKKARVAVVPAVIDGAFEAWPRGQRLPRPHLVYVTYCKAISPEEVRAWSTERIAKTVAERMAAALDASKKKRRGADVHAWLRPAAQHALSNS